MITNRKKIALLYICSGAYIAFWKVFYTNFRKYFLLNSEVHYHVFTDSIEVYGQENNDVHIHHIKHSEWPGPSLMRYHFFCGIKEELVQYDYCFFMNACMLCVKNISEEELLADNGIVIVVEHPGHSKNRMLFGNDYANSISVFERNPKAESYIPIGKEKTYVTGAINGADTKTFLKMSDVIKEQIDKDVENGIHAPVDDETYLNHYIYENNKYILLGSEYCHPQVFRLPIEQKIMIMEKIDLIDIYSVKYGDDFKINTIKRMYLAEQEKKTVLQKLSLINNCRGELEKILNRRGCSSVAIFGYNDMGDFLCDLLSGSNISIKYIIDNKMEFIQRDIPIIKEDEIKRLYNVDCIIVAHPSLLYGLLDRQCEQLMVPVFSIDELAHEGYMDALQNNKIN